MNPLDPSDVSEQELENVLRTLPRFTRSEEKEKLFLAALEDRLTPVVKSSWFAGWFALRGIACAVVVLVVTAAWSYQPSVTRGHFLYSLKKNIERGELATAFSSVRKIDTHVRFAERRLGEAEYIVDEEPKLAAVISVARAHVGDIHLDAQSTLHLAETLQEMLSEIAIASEIIEKEVELPADIERALNKIEAVTDKQVDRLAQIEKKVSAEVSTIVQVIAREQDEHLASVVEAHEDFKVALEEKKPVMRVKVMKAREKKVAADGRVKDRKTKAAEELQVTLDLYGQLTATQQEPFKEKVSAATSAIAEGKFGRAEGLSRAVYKRLELVRPVPSILP